MPFHPLAILRSLRRPLACGISGAALAALLGCGGGVSVGGSIDVGVTPGTGTDSSISSPPAVMAAGNRHTCVLDGSTQTVACWGANDFGQLGTGNRAGSDEPLTVPGLSGVVAIAAGGDHSCALLSDGSLQCWGAGASGQVGQGRLVDSLVPALVQDLPVPTVSVALGLAHSCALGTDAKVRCWGANDRGQMSRPATGTDGLAVARVPVLIPDLGGGAVFLAAGGHHSCAASANGSLRCWGANDQGQLGQGTVSASATPGLVQGLTAGRTPSALVASAAHSCALLDDGSVFCWGANSHGELGSGTASSDPVPRATAVSGRAGSDFTALSAGSGFSCAVSTVRSSQVGRLFCWGRNDAGQLGQDPAGLAASATPVEPRLPVALDIDLVVSGGAHTCAADPPSRLRCWGVNSDGQLGRGLRSAQEDQPREVLGFL